MVKQEEMGQEWAKSWTLAIGQQLAKVRGERGLSARELSEKTEKLGYPIPRNTITNLENGRKTSVSVAEITVLAAALNIPPVLLLYSMADEAAEQLPGQHVTPVEAINWFGADGEDLNFREVQRMNARDGDESVPGDLRDLDALFAARLYLHALRGLELAERDAQAFEEAAPTDKISAEQLAGLAQWERKSAEQFAGFLRSSLRDVRQTGVTVPSRVLPGPGQDVEDLGQDQ